MELVFPCYCKKCKKKVGDFPSGASGEVAYMNPIYVLCEDCQRKAKKRKTKKVGVAQMTEQPSPSS